MSAGNAPVWKRRSFPPLESIKNLVAGWSGEYLQADGLNGQNSDASHPRGSHLIRSSIHTARVH